MDAMYKEIQLQEQKELTKQQLLLEKEMKERSELDIKKCNDR
ncbi:MAG: hypothetical protein ACOH2C_13270 [Clostridium sp.]